MIHVRGILIDPFAKTVEPVQLASKPTEYEDGIQDDVLWEDMKKKMQCKWLQFVRLGCNHRTGRTIGIWVDEEGMLKDWDDQRFFTLLADDGGVTDPMAGRSLVLAGNMNGDILSTNHPLIRIEERVLWVAPQEVKIPAPRIIVTGSTAVDQTLDGGPDTWDYHNQPARRK